MRSLSKYAAWLVPVLLIGGAVALFLAQWHALASHRLDFPILDDWRYHMDGYAMPEELTLTWLLYPAQDTLHATGKLADWLFFHFVSHDYSRLAAASFGLGVGGWLVCAVWVCLCAGRQRPALVGWSLLAFALPLATVPYWGAASPRQWLEPAIAYHQMLPVPGLFLLGALSLSRRGAIARPAMLVLVAVMTLAFSIVYSSGALALLVFGAALGGGAQLHRRWHGGELGRLWLIGVTVAVVAGMSLLAHVVVPWWVHGINPVTETRAGSPVAPWHGLFWHFFFGLFDRAVLSTDLSRLSFFRGMGVALAVISPLLLLPAVLWKQALEPRQRDAFIVLLAVVSGVVSYAALVSYGRADFGCCYFPRLYSPPEAASLYAHSRFFYWWIAAILPLTVLSWGLIAEHLHSRRAGSWAAALLVIAALWPKGQYPAKEASYSDHWNYTARYANDAASLRRTIAVYHEPLLPAVRRFQREEWIKLPREERDLQYVPSHRSWPGKGRGEILAAAKSAGATFVSRWDLLNEAPSNPLRGSGHRAGD